MPYNGSRFSWRSGMFLFSGHEAHRRSFIKALTWRITGAPGTFVISAIMTGKLTTVFTIALRPVSAQ